MDINSLLSPQTSLDVASTATKSASPSFQRTLSSTLTSEATSSAHGPLSMPQTVSAQGQPSVSSMPVVGPDKSRIGPGARTLSSESQARQASTPGMDALADLASMQHDQQVARANAGGPRNSDVLNPHPRPISQSHPNVQALSGARVSPRLSVDHTAASVLTSTTLPRTYTASSLSQTELTTVTSLVSELSENPYLYESHLKLIRLLRRGLFLHVRPSADQAAGNAAHTYELLQDLQDARETMASRFPLGEHLWADWISDQIMLAKTVEDRIGVIELCQRAVAEEVGSVMLWRLYGDWVLRLYHASRPGTLDEIASKYALDEDQGWSEEEKIIGAEVFGWDTMIEVWREGSRATGWRIHDSHLIWDRYVELVLLDLANGPNQQKVSRVRALFDGRLQIPHSAWDQTFQLFSTFMTNYDNLSYEESMVDVTRRAADAKAKYAAREMFELKVQRALESSDELAEWTALSEYLEWEMAQARKKSGSHRLCNGLYERAVLRFGTDTTLWEDYVFYVIDSVTTHDIPVTPLTVLHRATRHCPWSGSLWAQYLLSSERDEKPFHEVEEVKHRATSTGLMDIGGVEEVLKAYTSWCGYLNRRAFHDKATDEEADVAEVGIRSAIEIVKELGEKKHGKEYTGDPEYRLERIYVEYLSRSGLWDRARTEVWKSLISTRGDSYEFWLRWYHWEMMYWYTLGSIAGVNRSMSNPTSATSVLRQAVARQHLDWPEKILEVYMDHVRGFESVSNLQAAAILARKVSKSVAKRRQQEIEQAALLQKQQQDAAAMTSTDNEPTSTSKRKRSSENDGTDEHMPKKTRPGMQSDMEMVADGQKPPTTSSMKRDRENATIIVKKLPLGVPENRVRQFFRDCGKMNTLKLVPEPEGDSMTATIEFESTEDVLAAQTKDMKVFDGSAIEVLLGTGTTVFVTNFPPTADESFIRALFEECGEILDLRFPSLKFNTHRRFCYVQFRSSEQASRATRLDGKDVGEKLKLVVKISDPEHKQNRSGAMYEGREIYVSNLDWSATEAEVIEIFSKYGGVERVRIPKNIAGKSKGIAFVIFSSKEEADAALDMNLTKFKSRLLNVSHSTANPAKRQATTIINADSKPNSISPSPPPSELSRHSNDQQHHPAITPDPPDHRHQSPARPDRETLQSRTLALLNVPDTVNDTRIRTLMEPYGTLVKVVLRPDHQGAIIEYSETKDAGRAALGVEGHEIVPGRNITVGTVKDMLGQKAEIRHDKMGTKRERGNVMQQSGFVKRPSQPGAAARRGGRGGLGLKRGGAIAGTLQEEKKDQKAGGKSNADFKAMFSGTT